MLRCTLLIISSQVNHQDRLGNMPIRGKIVLLVKQLVHVSREFKRSSQFVMCPLHLGRLLDKANHFFLRATRHLKAWHRTKRSDLYASETVDNGFTEVRLNLWRVISSLSNRITNCTPCRVVKFCPSAPLVPGGL